MAYTIKRRKTLTEQLILESNDSNEKLVIDININLDSALKEFTKRFRSVEVAMINIQKGINEDDYTTLGMLVLNLFTIVFGEENTKKICDFYTDNYTEMLEDVLPFITNVIKPKFDDVVKARKEKSKFKLKELKR